LRPSTQPESCFLQLNGARIHYLRAGDGPPLLLIHGVVGSASIWRLNIPALARHATVYALDLLGMGGSERVPDLAAGLEDTAHRVLATMDALGVAQADVAAASHGGSVAMMLAALAPERVRSLILFATANPYSTKVDWIVWFYDSALGAIAARIAPNMPRWIQQIALRRMYGDSSRMLEGSLDPYREALRVPGTIPHLLNIVHGWSADMNSLREILPKLKGTPALLIWGDRDRVVSVESGRRLEKELGAELVVFEGGGHLVFEEFAEDANRLIVEWLQRSR
jgi:pimeloyl-ACP methyl ester carboxylesterase